MTTVIIIVSAVVMCLLAFWIFPKQNMRDKEREKELEVVFGRQLENRRKELSAWAKSKGLSFRRTSSIVTAARYGCLQCLQKGDTRYAYNIMEGLFNSRKICAFDYYYQTEEEDKHGGRTITGCYYFSAVVAEADFQCKPLFIRTEKLFDKIAKSAGLDDINFESAEFNKQFYVQASDRRWAYDVVNQATMELLLSHPRFNVEFNRQYVVAYCDELYDLGHFEEALQLIIGIIDNLPKPLLDKKKGEKIWA
jgi:hypothetical protein